MSKFSSFFKVFLILPPVWLLNLGKDLSIDNIVRLGSTDKRIGSQDAVIKVLELTEKWKYPNFRVKFYVFFKILLEHDTPVQSLGVYLQCFLQDPFIMFCSQDIWIKLNVTFIQIFWFHFQIRAEYVEYKLQ